MKDRDQKRLQYNLKTSPGEPQSRAEEVKTASVCKSRITVFSALEYDGYSGFSNSSSNLWVAQGMCCLGGKCVGRRLVCGAYRMPSAWPPSEHPEANVPCTQQTGWACFGQGFDGEWRPFLLSLRILARGREEALFLDFLPSPPVQRGL